MKLSNCVGSGNSGRRNASTTDGIWLAGKQDGLEIFNSSSWSETLTTTSLLRLSFVFLTQGFPFSKLFCTYLKMFSTGCTLVPNSFVITLFYL
jgi:hypothetical protein